MKRLCCSLPLILLCLLPVQGQNRDRMLRQADKIARALYFIERNYVDTLDMEKAVDAMMEGLFSKLDPHSVYIPREKMEELNEPLDGSFEGVGIEYAMVFDTLTVQSVIAGGPAEAVGLRPGDKIIAIDGVDIAGVGIGTDGIRGRLRGPRGTVVNVTVMRGGAIREFRIRRDTIPIESIDAAYTPEPGIVYVKLGRFAQNSVEEFVEALRDNSPKRPRGIIIDLRGNGGGFIHVATGIANIFMEKGQAIVRTEGPGIDDEIVAFGCGFYRDGALVLLVDENSASASEIMAGALQDWDRAVIVGRRTFGKGLVQRQFELQDGSGIRLTVARYHTPSGRVVQSPYKPGERDEYYRQAQVRYDRGESFSRDSIDLPDSLMFRTLRRGRIVYGGGGIMPDIFVPYDTLGHNGYMREVIGGGSLTEYAYDYIDKHRQELQATDFNKFLKNYAGMEPAVFEGLVKYCSEKGIEPGEGELEACSGILKTRLKAMMARVPFGMTGYWRVINLEEDPEFKVALDVIRNWDEKDPFSF